jgi:hypothetical protein
MFHTSADYKSAIRQSATLRYFGCGSAARCSSVVFFCVLTTEEVGSSGELSSKESLHSNSDLLTLAMVRASWPAPKRVKISRQFPAWRASLE